MKHLKKIIPVLLIVMLLSVVLMSGGVQASDCTHEWGEWTAQDGKHSRTCTLCNSVITEDCNYYELITRPSCTENGFTWLPYSDCANACE